jgi:DNA-binding PadR family transcriptional regulator
VKLKPPSYLMLGMLRLGMRSGYAIKRAADVSTKYFWPTSLAQVYPELARLEHAGLVTRRDDSQGARTRSSYELTRAGEEALLSWLRSPRDAPPQVRDERMLRLFFADALPREDQLKLIERLRESDLAAATWIRTEIVPLAEPAERAGTRFPAAVARLSADIYTYTAKWLAEYAVELATESPVGGGRPDDQEVTAPARESPRGTRTRSRTRSPRRTRSP